MIKKIALIVGCIILVAAGAILGIAATIADTFRVQRAALIDAPPEMIFAELQNLHSWKSWSPYEDKDPQMKRTFSGPESGKGATYEWNGNDEVGQGKMEITYVEEPTQMCVALHFIKPFEGDNNVVFTLLPDNGKTRVTWAMDGKSPFISKIMQVFMNMDEMCGKDFEKGLAKLKKQMESSPG
ncbi:MAG: SRPBCC family protein [Candidatus Obscuribacterales bacterium]|nr:SRPBCC family protein [Candidatus Obscuribacterales bacterium]